MHLKTDQDFKEDIKGFFLTNKCCKCILKYNVINFILILKLSDILIDRVEIFD